MDRGVRGAGWSRRGAFAGACCGPHTTGEGSTDGPRVLTFRVITRVLASLVDDRHEWDARNGQLDSSGMDATDVHQPELQRFPTAVDALRDRRPDDLFGRPGHRFWTLLRDAEIVAVFDTDGRLHLPDRPPSELLPVYKRSRSLTAVVGETLGDVLP